MVKQIFKNPIEQADAISTVPPFDKEAIINYYTQYGDYVTDDAYADWAKSKGKNLGPVSKDALGDTRYPDYINDDEFLQDSWKEIYGDALEYKNHLATNPDQQKMILDARKSRGYRGDI